MHKTGFFVYKWAYFTWPSMWMRLVLLLLMLMELSPFRFPFRSLQKQLKDKLIIVCHGKSTYKATTTNVQSKWISFTLVAILCVATSHFGVCMALPEAYCRLQCIYVCMWALVLRCAYAYLESYRSWETCARQSYSFLVVVIVRLPRYSSSQQQQHSHRQTLYMLKKERAYKSMV